MTALTADPLTALWHAVGTHPEDSLPRLVLADWFDDNPQGVWDAGECRRCEGSGEPGWRHRHGKHGPGYYVCEGCADIEAGDERGSGRLLVPHPLAARGLRETADRVPWVKVFKLGFGWWCKRSFHLDESHLVDRELMDEMSGSEMRCDRDDTVRFDKRDAVSGGVILFPTPVLAVSALLRAWCVVHGEGE